MPLRPTQPLLPISKPRPRTGSPVGSLATRLPGLRRAASRMPPCLAALLPPFSCTGAKSTGAAKRAEHPSS
eukprot:5436569-Alexandrium_andersonii.AAC.1